MHEYIYIAINSICGVNSNGEMLEYSMYRVEKFIIFDCPIFRSRRCCGVQFTTFFETTLRIGWSDCDI